MAALAPVCVQLETNGHKQADIIAINQSIMQLSNQSFY